MVEVGEGFMKVMEKEWMEEKKLDETFEWRKSEKNERVGDRNKSSNGYL